jgi:AbrB family looped-hinge helix DNA binding protein
MSEFSESSEVFVERPLMARVKVGVDGRLLIPAELRKAAGIEPGSMVAIRLNGEMLEIATPSARLRRVQALLAPLKRPGESVVDAFIAERRAMWGEG